MNNSENKYHVSAVDGIILALVLGSLWGLCESVFGNVSRAAGIPFRGGMLTGIGMMLMGFGFGIMRRPLPAMFVALVAAATMQLSVPVLHCSFLCKANSGLAVMLHGGMLAGCLSLYGRRRARTSSGYALAGFSAAMLSSLVFYFAGMRLAPCAYLLSYNVDGGLVRFLFREGAVWGAFSALLLPAGVMAGSRAAAALYSWKIHRPGVMYGASLASIAVCLLLIIVSIQHGM